jgi:hypothetical protein
MYVYDDVEEEKRRYEQCVDARKNNKSLTVAIHCVMAVGGWLMTKQNLIE